MALLGSLFFCAALLWWSFLPSSSKSGEALHFEVAAGMGRFAVIDQLSAEGLVRRPLLMKLYVGVLAPTARFSERFHLLEPGLSPRQMVARLAELDSRAVTAVTLVEGWTHLHVARKLEEVGVCSRLGFEAAVSDPQLLEALKIPAETAEGYLFPARYPLPLDSRPEEVLKRFVRETRQRLKRLGTARHPDLDRLGFTEHDVITLASIVEKETGRAGERPRIARVFLNRLQHPEAGTSGRLQSDPTAVYGCLVEPLAAPSCSSFDKVATPEMLRDAKNVYNTYRHAGLPPGPIANPGELALQAVLHPAEGEELYFVADGEGGHTFTVDFEGHKKAVESLRAKRHASP